MALSVSQLKIRERNKNKYAIIISIAFAQGAMDLCSLSYFYIYFYDLGCSPTILSLIQGLNALPWCLKPFLGYLSDNTPLFGYKRKSYIFFISALEFTSHILMFRIREGLHFVVLMQIVQTTCNVFRNVMAGRI